MRKILSLFFALMMAFSMSAKVAFLVPAQSSTAKESLDNGDQIPERNAYDWFYDNYVNIENPTGQFLCYDDLSNIPSDVNVIWVNVDRHMDAAALDGLFPASVRTALANYVKAGGNLYLSTFAARLSYLMERTPEQSLNAWNNDFCCSDEWKVNAHFMKDGAYDVDRHGHAIYKELVNHEPTMYADNFKFHMQKGAPRSDRNCLWDIDDNMSAFNDFQNTNKCSILGSWGHTAEFCCAGLVEFFPTGDWKGTIVTNGLAACSFASSNTDRFCVELLTKGALRYLDIPKPTLSWNASTVPASGVIGSDHFMTATVNDARYVVTYSADAPEIANIGRDDGRIFFNYFGNATFKASVSGDGWNTPKCDAVIINSAEIPVTGGESATFAYVLPYSLHVMANYDNEEGRRPDYEAAQWFHDQFITDNVGGEHGCFVRPSDLGSLNSAIKILWIHNDHVGKASDDYYNDLGGDTFRDNLAAFVNAGGNIFVSKQATRLVGDLGRNDYPSYNNGGYADRGPWRVGNKWNFEIGGEIDHSTHRVFSNMGTNTTIMAWGRHTDNNCIWQNFDGLPGSNDAGRINQYETNHNCVILGAWGHYNDAAAVSPLLECVGFVEYNPTAAGRGIIIAMGLGSYHWAEPTDEIKTLTRNTLSYLNFMNARPCAIDGTTPMETKLAENGFYPSNTTSFLTVHPVCENIAASYTLTDPNNIARIQEGVLVGENTITQLQFNAAGTVTLHITLTETRTDVNWPTGTYEYDREITFSYANPDLAQEYIETDFPANAISVEGGVDMAMRLHPVVRGMDSVSYVITNHYDATQGEALKRTEVEAEHDVTRLYFAKSGKVLLTINLNEPNWVEAWPMGAKQFERVIEFNYTQEAGPVFPWPSEFETGAVSPNSVITLPETVGGLTVNYTVEGNASLSGNVLTLANVESGSVTVHASVTETGIRVEWPVGTYNYDNALSFHAAEVGYLLPAAESIDHMAGWYEGEQPEYNAATWFQETYIATGKGRFVTVNELPTLYAKGITTLWVNIERIGITTEEGMFTDMPEGLKTYIQAGGNVLLTKQATRLAYLMERIGYAPEFNAGGYVTTNEDNIRSISTLMGTAGCVDERLDMSGHRIYNDMLSYFEGKNMFFVGPDCKKTYNYCSWQDFRRASNEDTHYNNCLIQRVRDFELDWHATVFGIQGNIGDYCFSNIVEFNAYGDWQGRILTIGSAAYQWGTSNNNVERDNLKTLTANCLAYLANEDVPDEVYTRDVTPDKFGTICWGYAVEAGNIEGAEIYELTSFDETGNAILLTEVTSMVAGRPYFFLATSDQLRLTYNGQKAEGSFYNGLVGYIAMPGAEPFFVPNNDHSYILYNNELVKVDQDDIELPSNKAYVNSEAIPAYQTSYSPMRQRRMAIIHQTPTEIEAVEKEADGHVYDILGRKLQAPQAPGVYIKDGKKVLIVH